MELPTDPGVLLMVSFPVVPLFQEQAVQDLQGVCGQEVCILLDYLDYFFRLVHKRAPALGDQAASHFHLVHLLSLEEGRGVKAT